MPLADYSQFFLAFAFVLFLIWATAALAKRFGLDKKMRGLGGGGKNRLQLVDVLHLDPKRKLALVRADAQEYLLVLTGDQVVVVDKRETKHEV